MPKLTEFVPSLPNNAWPTHWRAYTEAVFEHHSSYQHFWKYEDEDGIYLCLTYEIHEADDEMEGIMVWVRPDRRGEGHVIDAVEEIMAHEGVTNFRATVASRLADHYDEMGFAADENTIYLEVS